MPHFITRTSSRLVVGTLALLCACEGTNPAAPPSMPAGASLGTRSNSNNAKDCQKNGWQTLATADGGPFASEEACVSYAAKGGTLYKKQTITFAALDAKPFGTADFVVSAAASSGLTVTFTASGNCTVGGSTVHLTGSGSCTITAHQAGNATWAPAADVARTFAIGKAAQTLTFTSTSPSFTLKGSPTYTPTAAATSGLAPAISLDPLSTGCSLTSGTVTFTAAGVCLINANQTGNESWEPAAQKQQSITVYRCIDTETLLRYAAATGGANEFCAAGTKIVLTQGEVVVGTTLSLTGVSGGNAIIDANATGRVLTVSGSLTLRDVTVTGGKGGERGGGIFVSDGNVVLNGSAAVDGNVAQMGGGLLMFGGSLTLNDQSSVSNNRSSAIGDPEITSGFGGGIFAFGSTITMNGSSVVRKNKSDGSRPEGAGIWMSDATLTMNGSSAITENIAASAVTAGKGLGGGVFLGVTTMTLNASASIAGNSAAENGGGIYRIAADVGSIIGVTATNVVNNTPNNCGGTAIDGCAN